MRILVVDDDPDLAEIVAFALSKDRHHPVVVHSGQAALQLLERESVDLIVLDLMMPQVDGYEVCRQLRARRNPVRILMLTAKDSESDKVRGLDLGADDYMTKPFSPRELLARVRALGRRLSRTVESEQAPLVVGGRLCIDAANYEITADGTAVQLTPIEHELLRCLALNVGRVVPYDKLLSYAWGPNYEGETELLKVHIRHLREKVERDPSNPEHLVTVRGIGYKLNR